MHQGATAVFLLCLTGLLQAIPLHSEEPLYPTQENFDQDRFLGKWHDIAVASTCPWAKKVKAIGVLELAKAETEGKLAMTRIVLRGGTCHLIVGEYDLTSTPGRFTYHVDRFSADVDAYVVHTVYDEYAIVFMAVQQSGVEKKTTIRLYSRTMTVRPTVMEDFRRLAKEQGMTDDMFNIKVNKGECTPTEMPAAEPKVPADIMRDEESQYLQPRDRVWRRSLVLPTAPAEEGSGMDDTPMFSQESCKLDTETGPCFGMMERYFYNSTSMSCQLFNYGGCAGNQNNFITEKECLQNCRTEAVCRLPMAAHPCTGQVLVWAFDATTGQCMAYRQGYCQGNSNKFYSKAECEEYCGVMKDGEGEFLKAN